MKMMHDGWRRAYVNICEAAPRRDAGKSRRSPSRSRTEKHLGLAAIRPRQ